LVEVGGKKKKVNGGKEKEIVGRTNPTPARVHLVFV